MRSRLFENIEKAEEALRNGTVNIAVVESSNTGSTSLLVLLRSEIPEAIKALPGFRFSGISGIPAAAVESYHCYRTSAEVMAALNS